jgi:hypothetical protein
MAFMTIVSIARVLWSECLSTNQARSPSIQGTLIGMAAAGAINKADCFKCNQESRAIRAYNRAMLN